MHGGAGGGGGGAAGAHYGGGAHYGAGGHYGGGASYGPSTGYHGASAGHQASPAAVHPAGGGGGGGGGQYTASYGGVAGGAGGSAAHGAHGGGGHYGGGSYSYGGGRYGRGGGGYYGFPRQAPDVTVPANEKDIIMQTFEKWDLKGNGYISEKELCHVLVQLGLDKRSAQRIFETVDMNEDRKIDYKEFVWWLYGHSGQNVSHPIIKEKALVPYYKCMVEELWVNLTDPRVTTSKPFVRWHDHFTNQVLCESPEGTGPSCKIDVSLSKTPLLFDIPGDDIKAVIVQVCEKRTLRSARVLAQTELPLASAVKAIASGLKGPHVVQVDLYIEAGDGKKRPVGNVKVSIKEAGSDTIWAKTKVAQWRKDSLPAITTLLEVNQVLETLAICPDTRLEMSAARRAETLALAEVEAFPTWQHQQAAEALDSTARDLQKLKATARSSTSETRDSTFRTLSEGREKVVSKVLVASRQKEPPDYRMMKLALKFAQDVDPHNRDTFEVERAFKELLKLPDHAKLDDLMRARDEDLVQLQPSEMGLTLAADCQETSKVADGKRFSVRDQTAERVLAMLGCYEKLHYTLGITYEALAQESIAREDFKPSVLVTELMKRVIIFRGAKEPQQLSIAARISNQKRDWEALLGRFDIVAVPVYAEYDAEFNALDEKTMPQGYFGRDLTMPIGGSGWFWIFHGAAINIGETDRAEDFEEYSIRMDPHGRGYRGRHSASRILDEPKYAADMSGLWRRALQCAADIGIEDMVVFPFGMGAFLRNLHQLDSSYSEAAPMRRLRKRVAAGLFEAVADVCLRCQPPMRVHVCLFDGGLEARVNHNVFVEAAGLAAHATPAIGTIVRFHRNTDALELARQLASTPSASSTAAPQPAPDAAAAGTAAAGTAASDAAAASPPGGAGLYDGIRKVGLLNGANNKLLGNHWFSHGARTAIDENLHRRSGSMCLGSLMLNMATSPQDRSMQELAKNAKICGSQVKDILPFPTGLGSCRYAGRLFAHVVTRPYGVLGIQQAKDGSKRTMAPLPDASVAIVDPADLQHILRGPGGAAAISDEIYGWVGIRNAPSFPEQVRNSVKDRLQAKAHDYGGKVVIHVVGPNLREGRRCHRADAVKELAEAYGNVLAQFATTSAKVLRLMPLCGLAGPFAEQLPAMTAEALQAGFADLGPKTQDAVLDTDHIEMCVYAEQDLLAYSEAFREPPLS